eukprot:gnl/TRDRNA2_/TRDRNA2_161026_c2_seq2.p1 gnl/TRDRNA2_/TRDRNA2_161026_c2~~gnl/TRDRNA2_/TRDRNA2_161026_c2_seq2.p1  ORF type:complete len:128 (+),score=10.04 gnl/TRDRNA2_/TRDRNA2_161026_c2_seq2:166-549(+)
MPASTVHALRSKGHLECQALSPLALSGVMGHNMSNTLGFTRKDALTSFDHDLASSELQCSRNVTCNAENISQTRLIQLILLTGNLGKRRNHDPCVQLSMCNCLDPMPKQQWKITGTTSRDDSNLPTH